MQAPTPAQASLLPLLLDGSKPAPEQAMETLKSIVAGRPR